MAGVSTTFTRRQWHQRLLLLIVVCLCVLLYLLWTQGSILRIVTPSLDVFTDIASYTKVPELRATPPWDWEEEIVEDGYDLRKTPFFTHPTEQQQTAVKDWRHADGGFASVEGSGLYTIPDICIEDAKPADGSEAKRILVVYNSSRRLGGQDVILRPRVSDNTKTRSWKLNFRSAPIPETHRVIASHPAYFIAPSCPGNLYHFWADSCKRLYGTLKATNRLNVTEGDRTNQVFYPASYRTRAQADLDSSSCYDPTRFQDILLSLGVRPWHGWYGYAPANVCYTNGVFGFVESNILHDEAEQYVMESMGYGHQTCPDKPSVTILQRKTRRILNAEQLVNVSKDMGFLNTAIHDFEGLAVREQFRIASCSDILIGVQGAGLAWLYFMPLTSAIVEIAWPDHLWQSKYLERAQVRGMKALAILNPEVLPNWEVYAKREHSGVPLLEDAKEKLLNTEGVWKWADVRVNVQEFREVLATLKSQLRHRFGVGN